MQWFLIALIGPILYACANHTDKYLISRYLKHGEVGSLIIFSSLFCIVALPIVISIDPGVFDVSLGNVGILVLDGMISVVAMLLYFYALNEDEVTYVVPFYQTIPLFAFVLGYVILGETVSASQGVASLFILSGALVLSFKLILGVIKFKKKVVLLMLGASLLSAITGVVFKLVAKDEGFWPSVFWELIGKIVLGVGFLCFTSSYRRQFLTLMKDNKAVVLGLNSLSESLFIVGEVVTQYATLLAPVALVLLVNAFQPFFVLLIGVVLTLVFPFIGRESLTRGSLIQKILGIGLIGTGAYLLGS